MKTNLKIGDKSYKVEILEIDNNLIKVVVDGEECFFKKEGDEVILLEEGGLLSFLGFKEGEKDLRYIGEEKVIKAPIGGILSKILVKKGQKIKRGDVVVVLLSMKMENEIIAESPGTVQELKVKKGDAVNKGDILIVLE